MGRDGGRVERRRPSLSLGRLQSVEDVNGRKGASELRRNVPEGPGTRGDAVRQVDDLVGGERLRNGGVRRRGNERRWGQRWRHVVVGVAYAVPPGAEHSGHVVGA